MKIRLVRPTEQLKEQAINFRQEFFDNHEMVINGSELLDKTDQYEDWLKAVAANTSIETVSVNWVVTDTFFAVDEKDQIIGIIDLRHTLNDFLKNLGLQRSPFRAEEGICNRNAPSAAADCERRRNERAAFVC